MRFTLVANDKNLPNLDLVSNYDEMLQNIICKVNDFRAPDNQLIQITNQYGQIVPQTYRIRSDLTLYYTCGASPDGTETDDQNT